MVQIHQSCGFLVYYFDEGVRTYLLLHYPQGHWDFVKGHTEEHDDDELATAKRELEEETGIKNIDVASGFMMTMHYDYRHNGELQEKSVDYFLGEVDPQEVTLSHEHQDFDWQPYPAALDKLTFDNARDILIAAEAFLMSK